MSGIICCWPPTQDGGSGALQIGLSPVLGGTPGEFLKVGPGGLLDQAGIPSAVNVGGAVGGGTAPAVLFVGAGGVLAQDPTHFGYAPSTGLLTHNLPGASDGSALTSTAPAEAGTPVWFQRLGGSVFSGVFDPVMVLGFNVGPANLPVNPAFGTMAINWEGNFQAAPGVFQTEFHWVGGRADGGEQIRILTASMRSDTGHCELASVTDVWAWFDAFDNALVMRFRGADSGSKAFELQCPTVLMVRPDNNSEPLIWNAGGGATSASSIVAGVGHDRNTFGLPARFYSNTGGPASHIFRTGVTMGGTGDGSAAHSKLTLMPEAAQTAPLFDLSGAGAAPLMKLAKTAIVPLGALVRFMVQDETGAVFYLTGQAA